MAGFRFWATDGFKGRDGKWGGDRVKTPGIPFLVRDKYLHATCGFVVAVLAVLFDLPPQVCVNAGGVLVECVEVTRLYIWWQFDSAIPRALNWEWDFVNWQWTSTFQRPDYVPIPPGPPVFADGFSWRDLIANNLGALPIYIYAFLRS